MHNKDQQGHTRRPPFPHPSYPEWGNVLPFMIFPDGKGVGCGLLEFGVWTKISKGDKSRLHDNWIGWLQRWLPLARKRGYRDANLKNFKCGRLQSIFLLLNPKKYNTCCDLPNKSWECVKYLTKCPNNSQVFTVWEFSVYLKGFDWIEKHCPHFLCWFAAK